MRHYEQLSYDEIIERYEQELLGIKCVYIKRSHPEKGLLVSLATHKNNGRYSSLESYYSYFEGDLLFLADSNNSYYLGSDGGAAYVALVEKFLCSYSCRDIFFAGASMAGYAAIFLALTFNGNAIVNNPQLNFTATIDTAWRELKENILKIPNRIDLDERKSTTESVIGVLFGRHPMDVANTEAFFRLCSNTPGLGVVYGHVEDIEHKYYIPGIEGFMDLLMLVKSHRSFMVKVRHKFPMSAL